MNIRGIGIHIAASCIRIEFYDFLSMPRLIYDSNSETYLTGACPTRPVKSLGAIYPG
jgi:hypothetical protein